MCVSHMGDFIVSGGHDRSLHLYKRTEEQVFIEEERELEQEQQIDQELDEQIFTYKTVVTKTPDDKIKKLFKTHKAEDGYYINSKILVLKNNIGADNKLYKDYFRQTILPYIMQVIPSTTILILEKF